VLVLLRKTGQKIIIGDEIEIMILGVKSGIVRVGIDAPKEITVHREEVYEEIHRIRQAMNQEKADQRNEEFLRDLSDAKLPKTKKSEESS
jgi:carbon storage regulator